VHRFAAEPRRLWRRYLIGNAEFVVGVARDQLGRLLSSMGRHPS